MIVPLVSVVIPTHNRVDLLRRAVDSVLAQTVQDFEIIIVNDGSLDGTSAYLSVLSQSEPRVISSHNKLGLGGGGARNVGISMATGKWVAFLDDDDEWVPSKLEAQLGTLASYPAAVACSSNYEQIFSSKRTRIKKVPERAVTNDLLKENSLGGASLCICLRKELNLMEGFDTKLRSGQDWDLWLRLSLRGAVISCDKTLVLYYAHNGERITKSMGAQYLGVRRFYFKHRQLMNKNTRAYVLANACFIMSRQATRAKNYRAHYLRIAVHYSSWGKALIYVRSSFVRLLRDYILEALPSLSRNRSNK